eukprot:6767139-Pyramimonas_sp.AAC.1
MADELESEQVSIRTGQGFIHMPTDNNQQRSRQPSWRRAPTRRVPPPARTPVTTACADPIVKTVKSTLAEFPGTLSEPA